MRRLLVLPVLLSLLVAAPLPGGGARGWEDGGSVAGRVSAAGSALAGAEVSFFPEWWRSGDDPWDVVARTTTDSRGRWRIDVSGWSLPPGRYLVRFADPTGRFSTIWYRQALDPEHATTVAAVSGQDVRRINARLPVPGRLQGRVFGNGEYLSEVPVTAFTEGGSAVATTATDDAGRFGIAVPGGRRYVVLADASSFGLLAQWWRDADSRESAHPVAVRPGSTVSGLAFDVSFQSTFPQRPNGRVRRPAASYSFVGVPVDPITGYQGQTTCRLKARKGTRKLRRLILSTYGPDEGAGLNRPCGSDTSEHHDGRAIDWMVNSRVANQARKGDWFTWWLTRYQGREPGAMARRIGVMYVIWRGMIWKQYQATEGWQVYSRCDQPKYQDPVWDNDCHRNHVHISLTRRGARMKTSWWTGHP